ncbi:GntR family transcriptional regulator [Gephyromycinifex aptenodytis]|uniref:GntR family transcriptional regulator n=1 Tax=Gephyromycinifex aptenodytis TaxID=2716227 RepID=UPI0014489379|nr:GntR family transcriptional regulator [Gephyromycinifex aptenodytis]
MSLEIRIDPSSAVPPFQQIVDHVVVAVREGELATGERLPTVRGLAGEVGVAVNTVAKAYRQLEAEGHVETLGRHGTVVRGRVDEDDEVTEAATQFAASARARGLDLEAAIGVLRRTW